MLKAVTYGVEVEFVLVMDGIVLQRKMDRKIGKPAQRHWQNGTANINLQYKNNFH